MNTTGSGKCSKCGANVPQDAPHGLCPRCLGALNFDTQTVLPGEEPRAAAPALSPAELAPLFPDLEILEFIGQGGMGAVYKARQKRLDRVVALKILPPGTGRDQQFTERFAREAKALARLSHPGIVTLYEFGQVQSSAGPVGQTPGSGNQTPLYFFLMEFVDGVNLRGLLRTGRVSPREALAIVPQICDALQYAHDRGIVHRDIKPENVLVDRRGQVKVADFGVAKLIGAGTESGGSTPGQKPSPALTGVGTAMGTPSYMAPEQRERPEEVDHRADIYALGVVFYEMLTGELPGQKLTPPSTRVRVDVRLDDIVLHALEKAPERRYQHVRDVKTAVDTVAQTPPRIPVPPAEAAQASIQPQVAAPSGGSGWKIAAVISAAAMLLLAIPLVGILLTVGAFTRVRSQQTVGQTSAREDVISRRNPVSPPTPPSKPSAPVLREALVDEIGAWQKMASAPISGRAGNTAIWTGSEMIVFGGEGMNVSFRDGARYDLRKDSWMPLPLEGASPSSRTTFTAIWTGEEMIIWGGFGGSFGHDTVHNDGSCFNPTTSVWRPVSTRNAPSPRFNHTAVWTGKEMLVWGGYNDSHSWYAGGRAPGHMNTGGRYDPHADTWREITTTGAPLPRFNHTAVWTGKEMLVWGGSNAQEGLNDGALYDPVEDSWRPVNPQGAPRARGMHAAVWTGTEMIVWGGGARNTEKYFQDGARYDPETDAWKPIAKTGAPKGRIFVQAIWTGKQMLVWGGVNDAESSGVGDPRRYVRAGALYDPVTDTWTAITDHEAPSPRLTSAVWTGDSLLTFGGYNGIHLNDVFRLKLVR